MPIAIEQSLATADGAPSSSVTSSSWTEQHGWQASLVTVVVVCVLIAGLCVALGIDIADAVKWLEAR